MTTRVLFVCVSNRGKSVMAEGLARLGPTAPSRRPRRNQAAVGGTVNELSAQVLAEVGGDISNHQPRQLTNDMMTTADLVIAVGTAAQIDAPTGTVVEVWDTDEPSLRGSTGSTGCA